MTFLIGSFLSGGVQGIQQGLDIYKQIQESNMPKMPATPATDTTDQPITAPQPAATDTTQTADQGGGGGGWTSAAPTPVQQSALAPAPPVSVPSLPTQQNIPTVAAPYTADGTTVRLGDTTGGPTPTKAPPQTAQGTTPEAAQPAASASPVGTMMSPVTGKSVSQAGVQSAQEGLGAGGDTGQPTVDPMGNVTQPAAPSTVAATPVDPNRPQLDQLREWTPQQLRDAQQNPDKYPGLSTTLVNQVAGEKAPPSGVGTALAGVGSKILKGMDVIARGSAGSTATPAAPATATAAATPTTPGGTTVRLGALPATPATAAAQGAAPAQAPATVAAPKPAGPGPSFADGKWSDEGTAGFKISPDVGAPRPADSYGERESPDTAWQTHGQMPPPNRFNVPNANWTTPIPVRVPEQYQQQLEESSQRWGVSPQLVAAVIQRESGWQAMNADGTPLVSSQKARGMGQFTWQTWQQYGGGRNIDDPYAQIDATAHYLGALSLANHGNVPLTLMAYNWGPGHLQAWKNAGGDPAQVPGETQAYVQSIAGQPVSIQNTTEGNPSMTTPQRTLGPTLESRDPPATLINILAQSKGAMPMSQAWQNYERQGVEYMMRFRGPAAAAEFSNFVRDMSMRGSNENMQGAYNALTRGDTQSAAVLLGRAHQFFPDGRTGIYGTDKQGNLVGQMLNDATNQPTGAAFRIQPNDILQAMNQTRTPAQFQQAVMAQRQLAQREQINAANVQLAQARAGYFTGRNPASIERTAISTAGSVERAGITAGAASDRADAAIAAKIIGGAGGPGGPKQAAIDKESAAYATQDFPDNTGQQRVWSHAYGELRSSGSPPAAARDIATGLTKGTYRMSMGRNGQVIVVDPATKTPIAQITPQTASLFGFGAQGAQNAPASTALH